MQASKEIDWITQ